MRAIAGLLVVIWLSGCVTSQGGSGSAATDQPETGVRLALGPPLDGPRTPLGVDQVYSTVTIPAMRNLLRSIAAKLTAHAPDATGFPYQPDIHITSDGYNAKATVSGDILVGVRVVAEAQSEDELAFILAHELAHLQSDHLANERDAGDLDTVINRLFGVLATAQEVVTVARRQGLGLDESDSEALNEAIQTIVISIRALQAVQVGIIAPAYNREQELEADAIALRMIADAGYAARPAGAAIKKVGESQKQVYQKVIYAIHSVANAAKVLFRIGNKYDLLGGSSFLPFDMSELIFEVATSATVAAFCEFSESHPTTEDRLEQLADFLKAEPILRTRKVRSEDLRTIRRSDAFKKKAAELTSASMIVDTLQELKEKADPFAGKKACGEEQVAATQRSVKEDGDRLIQKFRPDKGESDAGNAKPIDISGDLNELGSLAMAEIRNQRRSGAGGLAYIWAAFAEVRATQERFSDSVENFEIALRAGEAVPMLNRRLAIHYGELGRHQEASTKMGELASAYGEEWIADLAFELAVFSDDRARIQTTARSCRLAEDFFVQERCILAGLKHRKRLDEIGINPESYTPVREEKSFWESIFGS